MISKYENKKCAIQLFLTPILKSHFHMCLEITRTLFLSGYLIKNFYTSFISPISVTGPAHLVLHNLNILITFSEKYEL
jgi:hypothetical protein